MIMFQPFISCERFFLFPFFRFYSRLCNSPALTGGGVNICNHPGDGSNVYVNNVNSQSTLSGTKWECVEMVNRLYLTKGWTTANWHGNGGGTDGLIYHLPSNLAGAAQFNGS